MKKILYTSIFLMGGLALTSCSKDFTETKFYQSKKCRTSYLGGGIDFICQWCLCWNA